MLALGIDIGGTAIKSSLLRDGTEVWHGRSAGYARPSREVLVAVLGELVVAARTAGASEGVAIGAVGLCVPGLLAADAGSVAVSMNVPALVGLRFDVLLGSAGVEVDRLGTPMRVVTDALAAAMDASAVFGLKGRVLALSIGTGVGACVLDDEKPLIVSGQGPGHFGQVDVSLGEGSGDTVPIGSDGGRGSLESYVGVHALRARYGEDVEGALAGMEVGEVPCRALVRAIRIAHAIYRPDHVLLLGGVGIRLRRLAAGLREEAARELTSLARAGWTLRCGESDFHAARGAARIASG